MMRNLNMLHPPSLFNACNHSTRTEAGIIFNL